MLEEKDATHADTAVKPEEGQNTETDKTPSNEAETEKEKPEAKPEKKSAWFTRVIAREANEKREAKREAEIYKRQLSDALAALAAKGENTDGTKPKAETLPLPKEEIERRARELLSQRDFDEACNKIAEDGNDQFEDFSEIVTVLQSFGDGYETLLRVATDIPDAHKVLHHLGKNPEQAERLLSLPPTKMALGLAKLESEMSKAGGKTISSAPAPVTPIKPKSNAAFDPHDTSRENDPAWRKQWSEWRQKTKRKR